MIERPSSLSQRVRRVLTGSSSGPSRKYPALQRALFAYEDAPTADSYDALHNLFSRVQAAA